MLRLRKELLPTKKQVSYHDNKQLIRTVIPAFDLDELQLSNTTFKIG